MTRQVVLGVDVGKHKLGMAVVQFHEPHEPIWADVLSINEPDLGWRWKQVRRVLQEARIIAEHSQPHQPWQERHFLEITRVGIELPPYVQNQETKRDLDQVWQQVHDQANMLWSWADIIPLNNTSWKLAVLGKGNASKAQIKSWALDLPLHDGPWDRGSPPDPPQDACDALGIAVAAAMLELEVVP